MQNVVKSTFLAFLALPQIAVFLEHFWNMEHFWNKFGTKKVLFLVAPFVFFFYLKRYHYTIPQNYFFEFPVNNPMIPNAVIPDNTEPAAV